MSKPPRRQPAAQTLRQHRGLVYVFGAVTIAFGIVIVYFALASTTITIATRSQPVTVVFPLTIQAEAPAAEEADVLLGQFATTTATAEAAVDELTNTASAEGRATGAVTLTNTWSQAQPLAATTRLLSEGGVLFRTDAFVSVPANGEATVAVTADQAGTSGDISPSHFTIPGLSTELQQKIYGDSSERMTGGTVERAVVTTGDIESLRQVLAEKLTSEAQQTLTQQLTESDHASTSDAIRFFADPAQENFSAQAGDTAESLTGSATATVIGIALSTDALYAAVVSKLLDQLPDGETLVEFTEDNFGMALDSYDREQQRAVFTVTAHGLSTVDPTHEAYGAAKLTNKSRSEIISYLSGFSIVDTVTVTFSPFWVMRSPTLADHIKIIITNQ